MPQVTATIKFDADKGTATVILGLAGTSEMEHELLAAFFTSRSVSLAPFHNGDQLESRFVIQDGSAFAKAQRNVENRIRIRDGRPTVEQEEAAKAAKAKIAAAREAADKAAQAAGFKDAADKADHDAEQAANTSLAKAIVDEQEKRAQAAKAPAPTKPTVQ